MPCPAGGDDLGSQVQADCTPFLPDADNSLSRSRQQSSIPSEKGHWMYPSEQQFYKASAMKGNILNPKDLPSIVSIHNAVNEGAWERILDYERLHAHSCSNPKLLRFFGRPHDMSLKAKVLSFVGFDPPFDRHDWIIDRCGKEVRYVVDFYEGKLPSRQSAVYDNTDSSGKNSAAAIQPALASIYVDARPAISGFDRDSLRNFLDRIRCYLKKSWTG